jgi:hypothetical protein
MNINHPLPILWEIPLNEHQNLKKKIFYMLKIIDILQNKYMDDPSLRKVDLITLFISSFLPPNVPLGDLIKLK